MELIGKKVKKYMPNKSKQSSWSFLLVMWRLWRWEIIFLCLILWSWELGAVSRDHFLY